MRSDPVRCICFAREGGHPGRRLPPGTGTPAASHLHGFLFHNCTTTVALAPAGCDAHFIPLQYYGTTHLATPRDVDYPAVDESSGTAQGHDIVIKSRHQCFPIAVVFFNA